MISKENSCQECCQLSCMKYTQNKLGTKFSGEIARLTKSAAAAER